MSKTIVITGGTGFLGSSLVEDLIESGYNCLVFTRNPSEYNEGEKLKYQEWIPDIDYLVQYINGCYAVINLAGAPIVGSRWTDSYKEKIIKSRTDTTKALVDAVNKCSNPPEKFLSSSASGYFGDRGDYKLVEDDKAGTEFISQVCIEWEKATENLSKKVEKIIFRTGVVLHPDGGALQKILTPIKWYIGGSLGKGNQYIPWIHIADWKRFLIFALEKNGISQKNNLSAPNPVTMDVLTSTISKVYKRPNLFRVPEFVLKLVLGESACTVLDSARMIPENILKSNFIFKYDLIEEAIKSFKKD